VKKLLIILTLAVGLGCAFVWLPDACGQNEAAASRAARPAAPLRIAFIDLGEVIRKYKKFEDLSQQAQAARVEAGATYKEKVEHVQQLGQALQDAELDRESPEFAAKEKKLLQLSVSTDSYRQVTEKELSYTAAKIRLAVYLDVSAAAREFAEQNGYTLVLRIDREAEAAKTYMTIAQTMRQPVLRHENRDDITEAVIAWLNKQYAAAGGAASLPAAGRPQTATSKTPPRDSVAPPSRKPSSR
jgi:Skp family chaperone for outer membrane proteins